MSVWLMAAVSVQAAEIQVFAAASLTDALKEIAPEFEKDTGHKVLFNFGASSTLARQIQEGAPADIFFSADEAKMNSLEQRNLILTNSRRSLLSNSLVIVVAVDSPIRLLSARELADDSIKRIAIAEPNTVPAGIYAKEYLQAQGIWAQITGKLVPTENVRGALAAVESGNVEAGIVYKTDALLSRKVKVVLEIPPKEGPKISYPIAALRESSNQPAALDFLGYLGSPAARRIFEKFGFIVQP